MVGSEIDLALNKLATGDSLEHETTLPDKDQFLQPVFYVASDQSLAVKKTYQENINADFDTSHKKPTVMFYRKLDEIMQPNDHHLSPEQVKKLPQALHDPVAIFLSRNRQPHMKGLVLLSGLETQSKGETAPIVVALHLDNHGKLDRVASVYGKDKAIQVFASWQKEGLLVYTDPKQADVLEKYGIKLFETKELNQHRNTPEKTAEGLVKNPTAPVIDAPVAVTPKPPKKQDIDFGM